MYSSSFSHTTVPTHLSPLPSRGDLPLGGWRAILTGCTCVDGSSVSLSSTESDMLSFCYIPWAHGSSFIFRKSLSLPPLEGSHRGTDTEKDRPPSKVGMRRWSVWRPGFEAWVSVLGMGLFPMMISLWYKDVKNNSPLCLKTPAYKHQIACQHLAWPPFPTTASYTFKSGTL